MTASWFLRRVFPSLPVCWAVLLTAGYAVGGFFQTKYGFMQFLDHAAMFPLFALGLYRLVNGGRGWLYAAGLFLLATSLYSAFMAVVTGWLFAWAFTLPLKGTRERRVRLARVFWYTAADAGHLLLLAADGGNEPGFHALPVYDAAHVF